MKLNQLIAKFVDTLDSLDLKGIHIPGLIMSSPGAGKTSSLELYAKIKNYNLISLIASQYNADDILGLQSVKDGRLTKLTPSWFNHLMKVSEDGKRIILFIDEITTCDEFIQAPLLNLIFSRNLGEYKLPDNCFIIAAGNYSEELNGAFSITAPLVNRFMILNLTDSDYSIAEVLLNTFRDLRESDYRDYLDLNEVDKLPFKFDKFKEWISRVISFTPSNITNNREEGMLGFCSIRSLSYCMDYAQEYMSKFMDDGWIRVVGDTLGKYKSGDDWLPMRNKIQECKDRFIERVANKSNDSFLHSLHRFIDDFRMDPRYTELTHSELMEWMNDPDRLTSSEVREFTKLVKENSDIGELQRIYNKFISSLNEDTSVDFN